MDATLKHSVFATLSNWRNSTFDPFAPYVLSIKLKLEKASIETRIQLQG